MRKLYTSLLCFLLTWSFVSCDDFLSEYSQDMVIAKTVTHLDEVLLGSVYIPSKRIEYGPSGNYVCGFLNILDDDISMAKGGTVTLEDGTEIPITYSTNMYNFCVNPNYGYYTWQSDVRVNVDGSSINEDNITWDDLYKRINNINVILDEIVDMPQETEEDFATYYRVIGEAHFLRAQFYLMLANLYGKPYDPATCKTDLCVPLKLTPYVEHDRDKDTQFQRATVQEVYNTIVNDLNVSITCLKISPQKAKNRLHRASAEAASLLLSRVYLYVQAWDLAEQAASEVIESKNFMLSGIGQLENNVDFLTESNPEIIFSQGPNYLPQATNSEITPLAAISGTYCVSKELADMYDQENDKRYDCFFGFPTGDSIALENKYKNGINFQARISDVFTLRMAEAYLNKMEACAMLGHTEEANDLLNTLRSQRINAYQSKNYAGEELVNEIRNERRKELCFEGHRWFDLRRYSVNSLYPYSKSIVHTFNIPNSKGAHQKTMTFVLEEKDDAYTFAIPRRVLEFDKIPMESNPRPKRICLEDQIVPENK